MTQLIKTVPSAYFFPVTEEIDNNSRTVWINLAKVCLVVDSPNTFQTAKLIFDDGTSKTYSGSAREELIKELQFITENRKLTIENLKEFLKS